MNHTLLAVCIGEAVLFQGPMLHRQCKKTNQFSVVWMLPYSDSYTSSIEVWVKSFLSRLVKKGVMNIYYYLQNFELYGPCRLVV